jgi:hypothetical protein
VDVDRLNYLVIEDVEYREVVTVIEVLSPTNKYSGADREQYLTKRRQLLHSRVHFVEIDLLRGGPRMPIPGLPPCDYCAIVSRFEDRPRGGLWAWRLRDPLPVLPIPLREPHPPATLDLKAVLDQVYDAAHYARYLYQGQPHPQLSADDMAWARPFLPAQGG